MNSNPQPPSPRPTPPTTPSVAPDPLIDEVREIRRKIDEQFGGDIDKLAAALRERQQRSGRRIISDRGTPTKRAG